MDILEYLKYEDKIFICILVEIVVLIIKFLLIYYKCRYRLFGILKLNCNVMLNKTYRSL